MGKQRGLTRMVILVASSGIVAACAGASSDPTYTTRAAVAEGLSLADEARTTVVRSYDSGGMDGLKTAAMNWDARFGGVGATSKYVDSVLINIYTGEIIIRYSANLPNVAGKTLVLTPNLPAGTLLAAGATGAIEWACVSTTNATAITHGFRTKTVGTMPSQYAPTQCQ